MKPTDRLSIGQLADRTGLSVSAIRYYETQNLIESERNSGGQRRFLGSDIRRLPIEQIRTLLDTLPEGRTPNKVDWRQISRSIRQHLDSRIETLERLRDNLDGCIGCGCLSLRKCALYNPDDQAGASGVGPRYLLGERPKPVAK